MVGITPFALHELQLATRTTTTVSTTGPATFHFGVESRGRSLVIRQPFNVGSKGRCLVDEAGDTNKEKYDDVSEDALWG